MKLYSYKSFSSLEDLLYMYNYIEQKIWFTRLDELNDPFEACANEKYLSPQEIRNDNVFLNQYAKDLNVNKKPLAKMLERPEAGKWLGGQQEMQ